MDNYDVLRESITMPMVIERYLPTAKLCAHRIPCPFHGGHNRNLAVTDRVWYCHVCHAGGDMIEFVRRLLNLRFPETIVRLSADFGVPVSGKRASPLHESRILRELAAMQKRREEAITFSDTQLHALIDLRRWLNSTCPEDAQSVIGDLDAILDRHAAKNDLITWDATPMINSIKKQFEVYNANGDDSSMDAR
jgi:hypothetical protein